jgi:hypothetical protein
MPRAEIATKQAKFTLEQLHAELGGKILDNKKEAKRLAQCMKHVEAVLKMLEPGYNVRSISIRRRKPNPWFKRGTMFRHALDVLRGAEQPMTVREIVLHMLAANGATDASPKRIRDLGGAVQAALREHKGDGVTEHDNMRPTRWQLSHHA